MDPVSIYIHIPFCLHRCGYCDFNTYAGINELIPAYIECVCQEIKHLSGNLTKRLPVHTIYIGGGTPSLLPSTGIEIIFSTLQNYFQICQPLEFTIEANPGTVTRDYLGELHSIGVNRISLGMQSANADELQLLERQHSFIDVINSIEWARAAGFTNLNLDLIFGLPAQEICSWMQSIEKAVSLKPDHLSLYALTLETGTPMQRKIEAKILAEPDPDLAADMYEAAQSTLVESGYIQYEISNWAQQGDNGGIISCIHNLQYWRSLPYLGIGAGAHGYFEHQRTVNISSPAAYIRRMRNVQPGVVDKLRIPRTPATVQVTSLDINTEISETMIMGLRLVEEGVANADFIKRFGLSLETRFGKEISRLLNLGLIEWTNGERLHLTKKGQLLGNQVFREFI